MKNRIIAAILAAGLLISPISTRADGLDIPQNPWGEPFLIEATAYCDKGITADGSKVRDGIIAGKKEWIGKQAVIYTVREDGLPEYMGIYEFKDTGGDQRIREGSCIDIWVESEEDCINWGRRPIYIQIVDGKG